MISPWLARHPLALYPFRFIDPVTGRWTRGRYRATLQELGARYARWETTGAPEIREAVAAGFSPHR